MPLRPRSLALAGLVLAACDSSGGTTTASVFVLDASAAGDASCVGVEAGPTTGHACATTQDCITLYANYAPNGSYYAVCYMGQCHSAAGCVTTNGTAPNHCLCGDRTDCGDGLCAVTTDGNGTCVAACALH